jgi:ABC-type branched-subunit amino acid transport system ATPase component/branched-subunit amino acid ABC-type transport system permease component
MSTYVVFALIGLGAGAVYAGLAQGLVVTYKGTGIINFAQGAFAMWGAYVYSELRASGNLVFPTVVRPDRFHVGNNVPDPIAVALAVASAALLGLLVHFLVFRPLRRAPALAKIVASVGVLLTLQAIATIEFGSPERIVPSFLPSNVVTISGLAVPVNRFFLAGIAIATATLLWAWFRFTRIGLATRAAAENEFAASLAGYSPNRLGAAAWMLSGATAGLYGVLIAPVAGLNTVNLTLFVIPALAAALVGRLTSLGVACAAGLLLGVVQSELQYVQTLSWYPSWAVAGATEAIPFLLIVVALAFFGRTLPGRSAVEPERLPDVSRPTRVLRPVLVLTPIAAGLLVLLHGSYRYGLIQSIVLAIVMLSFVLLTGYVGQISLAQAAFAGVAGFTLSKLVSTTGIPFPLSTLIAAGAATILGVITAIPALRIRGTELAVVTLAVAVATEAFVFDNPSFTPITGNLIPAPRLGGLDLGVIGEGAQIRAAFGFLALGVLVLVAVGVANLARGATGRRFLALRSNERAAAAAGVSPTSTKVLAFALSSFIAGIGGAMLGYSRGQLSAESFDTFAGLNFLVFAYLGGITTITGAMVAGLIAPLGLSYVFVNQVLHVSGGYYLLIAGLNVIAIAIFNPVGIDGATRRSLRKIALLARRPEPLSATVVVAEPTAGLTARHTPPPTPRRRSRTGKGTVLEIKRLSVAYGGQRAVDDVTMEVGPGAVVGLIGPNGAGKTSIVDAITGFVPYTGCVFLDGDLLEGPPHARSRRGVARTWQSLELFDDLTVRENLLVAAEAASPRQIALDLIVPARRRQWSDVTWAIELLALHDLVEARPPELPLSQRKQVGIARALASGAQLVLLDEPAAGLDRDESRTLADRFRTLAENGLSVLVIDHDVNLLLDVCDQIYVLDVGKVVAAGPPVEIRAREDLVAAYVGRRAPRPAEQLQPSAGGAAP